MKQETTSIETFKNKLTGLTEYINVEDGDALIVIASKQNQGILSVLGKDDNRIIVELCLAMHHDKRVAHVMQMAVKAYEEIEREERQTNKQQNNGK